MELVPNKEKIRRLLENSIVGPKIKETEPIEYKYKSGNEENINLIQEQEEDIDNNNDDFRESIDTQSITNPLLKINNTKKYPYNSIGIISVIFPLNEKKIFDYTCFLIGENIILTLSSNEYNKVLGGNAKLIKITFSSKKLEQKDIQNENEINENKNLK